MAGEQYTPEQIAEAEKAYEAYIASKKPKLEDIFGGLGAIGDKTGTGSGPSPSDVKAVEDFMWEQGPSMVAGAALAPFTVGMSIPAQAVIGSVGGEVADYVVDYFRETPETFGQRAMDVGVGTGLGTVFGAGGRALNEQPLFGKIKPELGAGEQAAARYFDRNYPKYFGKPVDKVIASGKLPPDAQFQMKSLQEQMATPTGFANKVVKDVFDAPKFNSANEGAYALELQQAIPDALDSNVITHTGDFNPITLKYEQPFLGNMVSEVDVKTGKMKLNVTPSKSNEQVIADIGRAKNTIMEAKHKVIADIDAARGALNQTTSQYDPAWELFNNQAPDGFKIPGINFDQDILPQLRTGLQSMEETKPLISLIKQRLSLPSAAGEGQEMLKVINELELAMGKIQGTGGIPAAGQFKTGDYGQLGLKEANDLLENINSVRRNLKAFDRAVAAGQIQGVDSSKLVSNAAANEAWKITSEALRNSMKSYSENTLVRLRGAIEAGKLPMTPEYQLILDNYTPELLGNMNKKYGSFIDLEEAFQQQQLNTLRADPNIQGRSMVGSVERAAQIPTNQSGAIQAGVNAVADKFRYSPSPVSSQLLAQDANRATVKNLTDLMTIRSAPPVSRDFYKTMQNRDMVAQMLGRAAMMGIYAGDEFMFNTLPEPAKKQIHEQVILSSPDIAEDNEGYKSLVNGRLAFPEEQQMHNEKANAAPLEQRIRAKEGLINGGRYVPINPTQNVQPQPNMAASPDYMQRAMQATIEPEFSVQSRTTETEDMLSHMYRAMNMVDASRSGDKF